MARVVLDGVSKCFGKVEAIRNVSLDIGDKEFLMLLGPSGCGKSTILRLIVGLEDPSDGRIYVGDRLVNDVPTKERDIAMVFQEYALYPHMSVSENMGFALKLKGVAPAQIDERVKAAAAILSIAGLLDRKPKELSGGQRQRAALGRAIVRQPSVFLFDEPLSNLDAKLRAQMRSELRNLHEKLQATMICVTHDQVEAMTMGTRIVVMKDGEVQQADKPSVIYERPANMFVAEFVGSPPMNFIPATVKCAGEAVSLDVGYCALEAPPELRRKLAGRAGEEVILGIRPEELQVRNGADAGVPPRALMHGTVAGVEALGPEMYVSVRSGKHMLTVRTSPDSSTQAHQPIALKVNPSKIHVFESTPPHARVLGDADLPGHSPCPAARHAEQA